MIRFLQALLQDYLGVALALLGALVILACWFAYRVARSARPRPELDFGAAALRPEDSAEAVDLTARPPRPDLRRSFARAKTALKRAFPGARAGYERPWVLVLGPTLSGKTTLLEKSRLGLPFGQPRQERAADHPGLNWWAFEGGVVLDVIGEDVLRPDGLSSDEAEWRAILRHVRRSRPRRPVDGVVLTLPVTYFLNDKKPLAQRMAEAARRGTLLQRKLAEAQRSLGMRLPVFLLISHCDLLPGFSDLLRPKLDETAQHHQQMLGWSNPATPTAPYSGAWLEHAFDLMHQELEAFQLRALAEAGDPGIRTRDFVLLPKRLRDIADPLGVYANQLFSPSAASEPPLFRGVYLCGGGEAGSPAKAEPAAAAPGPAHPFTPSEVAFVGDLLERKVFPEAGLAQPTERAAVRARAWRGALLAITLGSLLWGAYGYLRGAEAVRAAASEETPFLGLLTEAALTNQGAAGSCSPAPETSPDERARRVLACGGEVETFRLRSLALPGSWLSSLPARRSRLVEAGMKRTLFDPVLSILTQRTDTLIRTIPSEGLAQAPSEALAVEQVPEFQQLDQLTQKLEKLDRTIAVYQSFSTEAAGQTFSTEGAEKRSAPDEPGPDSSLQSTGEGFLTGLLESSGGGLEPFGRLSSATLGARLEPANEAAATFFDRRLAAVGATRFDHDHRDFAKRLEARTLTLSEDLFHDLFVQNPLWIDLITIKAHWPGNRSLPDSSASELDLYRRLEESLARTRRHLELAELQWTAADVPDLGPRFDEILRRIHDSPFLGPDVSDAIKRMARAGFVEMQQKLADFEIDDSGPLLVRADQKWELAAEPLTVLAGLESLLGESFVEGRCRTSTFERYWRPEPLEQAVALFADYKNWTAGGDLPEALEGTAPEVAAEAIARSLACRITEAQPGEFPPIAGDPVQLEESIGLQVQNLQAVEPSLQTLLDALGELRLASGQSSLAGFLRDQRTYVLEQLDTLRSALDLYPTQGVFRSWQGEPGPALVAFGKKSPDEIADYLKTQREIVTRLSSEYAEPVLAMFANSGQLALLRPVPPASSWQRISADLAEYGDKQPGNSIAALEGLISSIAAVEPPDEFDLTSCFTNPPAPTPSGSDFFLARRTELRSALLVRCRQLADQKGYEYYTELGRIFNQRLWGRFPFAAPSASGSAAPEDIRAFFEAEEADFATTLLLIDNLPEPSRFFGDRAADVRDFMHSMHDVRRFFAPFLAPEAKSPNPIYDLRVRFRIERSRERGANQIISWLMSVGEPAEKGERSENGEKVIDLLNTASVSPAPDAKDPDAPDGRWLYGKPVTLTFGWATGSEFSPFARAADAESGRPIVDGRRLVYRYREPWSLLRLLAEHKAPTTEFPDLSDPNPQTVKFSIDTVSEASPEEPRSVATVYLRISLLSPDENVSLSLPDFPVLQAPLTEATAAPAASGDAVGEPPPETTSPNDGETR